MRQAGGPRATYFLQIIYLGREIRRYLTRLGSYGGPGGSHIFYKKKIEKIEKILTQNFFFFSNLKQKTRGKCRKITEKW